MMCYLVSPAVLKIVMLWNGVSKPNLIMTLTIAFGDLLALMMRSAARLPLEYVATSLVVANLTVVAKRPTDSTNQEDEPLGFVSLFGFDV